MFAFFCVVLNGKTTLSLPKYYYVLLRGSPAERGKQASTRDRLPAFES